MCTKLYAFILAIQDDSGSETEIWEEGTEAEILLDIDQQPPNLLEELSFGAEGYLFTIYGH